MGGKKKKNKNNGHRSGLQRPLGNLFLVTRKLPHCGNDFCSRACQQLLPVSSFPLQRQANWNWAKRKWWLVLIKGGWYCRKGWVDTLVRVGNLVHLPSGHVPVSSHWNRGPSGHPSTKDIRGSKSDALSPLVVLPDGKLKVNLEFLYSLEMYLDIGILLIP